jgi:putative sterol carrier protein
MNDLFSPDGINAWRDHLHSSDDFSKAAGNWRGTMLLVEGSGIAGGRATWLEVGDGKILEARPGKGDDHRLAEFVLAADAGTWVALVTGKVELVAAAMAGRLKLVSGSVLKLLPHASAASKMLKAAGGIES